jgi:hypothetical protein
MTPQAMAARPEFPVFSNLPPAENLKLHTQQAKEKDKTISIDYRDTVDRVIAKFSTLDDLFAFYWIAHNKTDFQRNSIDGFSFIISDCVKELKEINK